MPSRKVVETCLFCETQPCECSGAPKKRTSTRVRTVETGLPAGVHTSPIGSVAPTAVLDPSSEPAVTTEPAPVPVPSAAVLGTAPGQALDDTATALLVLARAGVLHPNEIKHHKLERFVPMSQRLSQWKNRRAS